jgi:hypothetical protein
MRDVLARGIDVIELLGEYHTRAGHERDKEREKCTPGRCQKAIAGGDAEIVGEGLGVSQWRGVARRRGEQEVGLNPNDGGHVLDTRG